MIVILLPMMDARRLCACHMRHGMRETRILIKMRRHMLRHQKLRCEQRHRQQSADDFSCLRRHDGAY